MGINQRDLTNKLLNPIEQCIGCHRFLNDVQKVDIQNFINLICKWNGLNLIAKSTQNNIYQLHILDALSIWNLLENDKMQSIVDFGAGGGVIGISLAIIGIKNIILIERSLVKLNFLKNVACFDKSFLSLNVTQIDNYTCIVRGVNKIAFVLKNLNPLPKKLIFFKSNYYEQELCEAATRWQFQIKIYNRCALSGKIVVLDKIKKIF